MSLFEIHNLSVSVEKTPIVDSVSLSLDTAQTIYVMGPNGSGKSSLALALAGYPGYQVEGKALLNGENLLDITPEKRAQKGLFLSMQHPPVVKGVTVMTLLKNAYQALGGSESILGFQKLLMAEADRLGISRDFLRRTVNEGFSGGEKKRMELLQLAVLRPAVAILDEPDSGLDVDGIQLLATELARLQKEYGMSLMIISHYAHLLQSLPATSVYVMKKGKIVTHGQGELVEKIQAEGFEQL